MTTHDAAGQLTTRAMKERWTALGAAIAEDTSRRTPASDGKEGTLTILGSGIAHGDLTIEAENEIRAADHVFFSINNYVTKSWIGMLRPDAYDLSILYNEEIDRHSTYTRMAEAILHYVRRGKNVVAIFYGHPGIFAAPGHRAIQIARQEGHVARMRPAVSALDHLIADIGFDPALPGMVTYEATSMLLRKKRIDTTLHAVIWQVGVVGEYGYNRQGYLNRGVGVLTDTLARAYGQDWEIVHYVGAQYAGTEPRIDRFPVKALADPAVAKKLNTLSTFYISPKDVAITDPARAKAFGIVVPPRQASAKRWSGDYSRYGPKENRTLADFSSMTVSAGYTMVQRSAVIDFLAVLSEDAALRTRFNRDPRSVLDTPKCQALSTREKDLLAMRNRAAVMVAVTGWTPPDE